MDRRSYIVLAKYVRRMERKRIRPMMKYCCTSLALLAFLTCGDIATGLSMTTTKPHQVLVVGKVIIDEYRTPQQDPTTGRIRVGGGGPQAAFGAAAAMAILSNDTTDPPLPQPVYFVGPVGGLDWSSREDTALHDLLGPAIRTIHLIKGEGLRTPRIQLWHDDEQNVQWRALFDSLGDEGAGGLWNNRPCADDILEIIDKDRTVICHAILEGGATSPGSGQDIAFLKDISIQQKIDFLGIEPVVFVDQSTHEVSVEDSISCMHRMRQLRPFLKCVSPDLHLYKATAEDEWTDLDVGVRDGPRGSILIGNTGGRSVIPAAKLSTFDGNPVNPTGAGNAYAAALTVCRGLGVPAVDAACIASAVGAVVCEYDHLPPWTTEVVHRLRSATVEVRSALAEDAQMN